MSIFDIVKQGFRVARAHKALWLFGFVAGIGLGGGGGSGGAGGGQAAGNAPGGPGFPVPVILAVVAVIIVVAVVLKFLSDAALIEGVSRARQNGSLTVREGFRVGWANWGVLFRIAAIYAAATLGSVLVLAAPCFVAVQVLGRGALVPLAIPTVLIAIPWLVTLKMLQALASRIAVLENRRTLDAIRKARLFLHGRLLHVLKVMVAAFVGPMLVAAAAFVAMAPIVLLLVTASKMLGPLLTGVIGALTLGPVAFIMLAVAGTMNSAAWTIGYVAPAER